MKNYTQELFSKLILTLFLLFAMTSALAQTQPGTTSAQNFDQGTVLVKFKKGVSAGKRSQAHLSAKGQLKKVLRSLDVEVINVTPGTVRKVIEEYGKNPDVEYAEPNYKRRIFDPITNEGSEPGLGVVNNFTEQWALENTGQAFGATVDPLFGTLIYPSFQGTTDADIDAPDAWNLSQGDSLVAIAILDSGVACNHLDLDGKCLEEINFVDEHLSPNDDLLGHGSHVAGIAAASTDNSIGIAGVGWDTSIGSYKVCYEDDSLAIFGIITGVCEDADVADAIIAATDSGLYQVINMSLAGSDPSVTLESAVNYAWTNNIVVVAGAGNAYSDEIMYPAGYDNAIAVASTDYHDNLSAFSSFGQWVDVLAPGTFILSTVPGEFCGQDPSVQSDCYDAKSGTSMSTPHVAGLAALLWAHQQSPTNATVRAAIEDTANTVGALGQNFQAWVEHGRINMAAALNNDPGPPDPDPDPVSHHVQSIFLDTVNAGRGNKHARVTVSVVDDQGGQVANATVHGTFSGDYDEQVNATTNASGSAVLMTTGTQKGGVNFQFCVDDIAHQTTSYAAGDDLVSCPNF